MAGKGVRDLPLPAVRYSGQDCPQNAGEVLPCGRFPQILHDGLQPEIRCRNLPEESDREVANLLEIKDHYPKYVVTMDELAAGNINGVKIVHLADFLLSKDY